VPTVDLVDVTREGVRDEEYTFTVPVTEQGTRQVQRQYYDVENRERQVARYVLYSSDSGDGINSGSEDQRISLNSAGDSDVDNDLADNIGYIKAAKHGPEAGAKFGYTGPHPGAHWKEGQHFSSEDDLTLSAGDATSDDLFVSADSSDDLRVVYDTVVDRVVVPRTETVDVPYSYTVQQQRTGTRQVPFTFTEQVEQEGFTTEEYEVVEEVERTGTREVQNVVVDQVPRTVTREVRSQDVELVPRTVTEEIAVPVTRLVPRTVTDEVSRTVNEQVPRTITRKNEKIVYDDVEETVVTQRPTKVSREVEREITE
jgi:hypothetical protein